ncbi:MAG: efflux RND transporter periplasmic adaptor subunit [Phyllobacterium sp.]|uniref:efflux RND transporter periplasmic adaptor subunit n=1 Tax=Phyllobacterium sp. TaxID=1871046 RepID=UPI0030F212F6
MSLQPLWVHKWFVLCALVLISVGGWQGARMLFGPEVVVDKVTRGNLVQTIVASGHIETPYRVEIGSQITGTVNEVLVEEGQRVEKGEPLIALEASEFKATMVEAQGALAQAEARLRQLRELTLPTAREALEQAQATLLSATQTYDRAATLNKNGYATKATLDDAQKNLDVARTQVRTAQLQVFTTGPGGSGYVMAETQLNQAAANLETARSRLGYATIVAPRDGVLISRNVERGTVVQPGKALLVLAPSGTAQVVIQIDEKNLGLLTLGQSAIVSADAYPDKNFIAQVAYINPALDITRASVEVKLNVPDPPKYLIQDMTVSVDIKVAESDNTLILPLRAIYDALSGSPWVMTASGGRTQARPVKLGLRGATHVEILDGIAEGAYAVPRTAQMRTGQRMRPVQR